MKPLIDYIIEGRKQKVSNWKQFSSEAYKFGHNSPEYFKYMTDYLVNEILWKYEIKFKEIETNERKMGYSGIPAKVYVIKYDYKGHTLSFRFNSFFSTAFVFAMIDDRNITETMKKAAKNYGYSSDIPIEHILCNREVTAKYKELLDELVK